MVSEKYEIIKSTANGHFVCAVAFDSTSSSRSLVLWRGSSSSSLDIASSCYTATHDTSADGGKVISLDLLLLDKDEHSLSQSQKKLIVITCTRRGVTKYVLAVSMRDVLLQSVCEYSTAAGSVVTYARIIDEGSLALVENNVLTIRCLIDDLTIISEVGLGPCSTTNTSSKAAVVDIAACLGNAEESEETFYIIVDDSGSVNIVTVTADAKALQLSQQLRSPVCAASISASADTERRSRSRVSINMYICDSDNSKVTYYEIDVLMGNDNETAMTARMICSLDVACAMRSRPVGALPFANTLKSLYQDNGSSNESKSNANCNYADNNAPQYVYRIELGAAPVSPSRHCRDMLIVVTASAVLFVILTGNNALKIIDSFDLKGVVIDNLSTHFAPCDRGRARASGRGGVREGLISVKEGVGGEGPRSGVACLCYISAFSCEAHQRLFSLHVPGGDTSGSGEGGGEGGGAETAVPGNSGKTVTYSFLKNNTFNPEPSPAKSIIEPYLTTTPPASKASPIDSKMPIIASRSKSRFDWNTPAIAKDGSIMNQPVTFHTKIKSSGYGQGRAPAPLHAKAALSRRSSTAPAAAGKSIRKYDTSDASRISAVSHQALSDITCIQHPINSIAYNSDATHMAVCSGSNVFTTFHLPISRYPAETGTNYIGHDSGIQGCQYSNDKRMVITTSADRSVRIFKGLKVDGAAVVFSHELHNPGSSSTIVKSSTAGRFCQPGVKSLTYSAGGTTTTTPTSSSSSSRNRNRPFVNDIVSARFFYQDKFALFACKNDVLLYTYDCEASDCKENDLVRLHSNGKYSLVHKWSIPGTQAVTALSSVNSVSSSLIVVCTSSKQLVMLDAHSGRIVSTIEGSHDRAAHHIELPSPSLHAQLPTEAYNIFLTAATDNCINIWDVRTPKCVAKYSDHVNRRENVKCSLSPCMRYIGTGSEDRTARIVDMRNLRDLVKISGYHKDVVTDVRFSPLFPQVATASFDGTVRFYNHCSNGPSSSGGGDVDNDNYYSHFMGV